MKLRKSKKLKKLILVIPHRNSIQKILSAYSLYDSTSESSNISLFIQESDRYPRVHHINNAKTRCKTKTHFNTEIKSDLSYGPNPSRNVSCSSKTSFSLRPNEGFMDNEKETKTSRFEIALKPIEKSHETKSRITRIGTRTETKIETETKTDSYLFIDSETDSKVRANSK